MDLKTNALRASRIALSASALILGSVAIAASPGSEAHAAPAAQPAIEPGAREALVRMGVYLKALPAFVVHEEITREQVIDDDLKVQKASLASIMVRRPDRMRADVIADDDKNHSIFYDGKTMSLYMPPTKYYAQMAAPATISATIDVAEASYGVDFPSADFLRMAAGDDLTQSLTAAGYVGKSRVGDTDCEHYAYRTPEVDYQLWVESGEKPLPRKLVITSKTIATQPEYVALLNWDLTQKIDDAAFVFVRPAGTTKIPFGMPPPAKAK